MKVGIVGCGAIAAHHLPHVIRHPAVRSVALADVDASRAGALARRYRIREVLPDLDAMLDARTPDVVHILTPPQEHAHQAIQAMEARCHVLVEKPMARSRAEAEAMIAAAERTGVRLCVNHNLILDPLVVRAMRLLEAGDAGRLVHVDVSFAFDIARVTRLADRIAARDHWTLGLTGGPITDYLAHPASLLLHFIGRPLQLSATSRCDGVLPDDLCDELRVLVDGEHAAGTLSVSLGTRPDCMTVTLYATRLTAHVNITNMTMVVRRNRRGSKKLLRILDNFSQAAQLVTSTLDSTCKIMLRRVGPPGDVGPVIRGFYRSIEHEIRPPVTAEQGLDAVTFIEDVWSCASAAELQEVA